ncbi:hypothetical protein N0V88_000505 [Collariella sp. IMI 366227]|nr:hypothetical protein N0V88_000505 [Collariella sp. IMI 366227]
MDSEAAPTHEEIWDDSALVDSWNEALREYKKYHSVHAKGGSIDDIVKDVKETAQEDEIDETIPMDESDETSLPAISDAHGSVGGKKVEGMQAGGPHALGPQVLLGTIQDEELKKLLMSWYYAGYYTGLFEGKQQGLQQAEQARRDS